MVPRYDERNLDNASGLQVGIMKSADPPETCDPARLRIEDSGIRPQFTPYTLPASHTFRLIILALASPIIIGTDIAQRR